MTRTIAALLAAATIAGLATPAAAQTRYFARERLVGMPTSSASNPPASTEPTYAGTYSLYYGACVGGMQTAPISSCKDDGGRTVSNSLCPSRSEPKACIQPSCDVVEAGYTYRDASINSVGRASSAQDATNLCSKAMTPGKIGGCYWNSSNNGEGPVSLLGGNAIQMVKTTNQNLWVSRCS